MKRIRKLALLLGVVVGMMTSCDDLLEVKPKDQLSAEDNYNVEDDVHNAALGIYSITRDVAERSLILSGLMGDLMTTTSNSAEELVEIEKFRATSHNKWANPEVFFNLIINCNDFIKNVPNYREKDPYSMPEKVYEAHMSTIRLTRVWAYLNLGKLYGSVPYFSSSIESIDQMEGENAYTVLSFEELITELAAEVQNIGDSYENHNVDWTGILGINDYSWNRMMVKKNVVEAELYLWQAAINHEQGEGAFYYDAVYSSLYSFMKPGGADQYKLSSQYSNKNWSNIFKNGVLAANNSENITGAYYSKANNQKNSLQYLFSNTSANAYQIAPSAQAMNMFLAQESVSPQLSGDTYRGDGVSFRDESGKYAVSKYSLGKNQFSYDGDIFINRAPELWLFLAEAFNGLGKHEMAMGLINNGLKAKWNGSSFNAPFNDTTYVFESEFKENRGLRGRAGLKAVSITPTDVNEDGAVDAIDSTYIVQDYIAQETALELAFESKRWFSLMRFAMHRNDPAFLANRVASSFPEGEREEIRSRLMNKDNWYLPSDW